MRFRDLELHYKLILPLCAVFILVIGLVLGYIGWDIRKTANRDMYRFSEEAGMRYAEQISSKLSQAAGQSALLAGLFRSVKQNRSGWTRYGANQILKAYIEQHPEWIGVYAVFEKNAFNSKDNAFLYMPGHDESGRFVPYWTRDPEGRGFLESLEDHPEWMERIRMNGVKTDVSARLIGPFRQRVQGQDRLVVSSVAPLDTVGPAAGTLVGIDIGLDDLQRSVSGKTLFRTGHLSIYTADGTVVASPDLSRIGRSVDEETSDPRFRRLLGLGEPFSMQHHSQWLGRDVLTHTFSIRPDGLEMPWMAAVHIPSEELSIGLHRMMSRIILAGLIGIGFVLVISFRVSRSVTASVAGIVLRLKEISRGDADLAMRIPMQSQDEMGQLAESFNIFVSKLHDIVSIVRDHSDNVSAASMHVRSDSADLSRGALAQQAEIAQGLNLAKQVSLSLKRHSELARHAAEISKVTGSQASEGSIRLVRLHESIDRITDSVRKSRETLDLLQQHSRQISKLVENIHDLSSRTRVLALNASIEAVKAGAAGGGFLVVAREIKSLAVKSAGEAEAITETLQEITRDVEESSRDINHVFASVDTAAATSRETGKVLSGTIASFSRIADMVSQIGEDAGIETDHAREIVDTFEIVSKISRNIAGSSENLAAAADRMNVQTNDLRSVVYQFRLRSRPAFTGGSEPDPVPASQVPEASPA